MSGRKGECTGEMFSDGADPIPQLRVKSLLWWCLGPGMLEPQYGLKPGRNMARAWGRSIRCKAYPEQKSVNISRGFV